MDGGPGYSYPVDWWSLGVTAYELLRGWVSPVEYEVERKHESVWLVRFQEEVLDQDSRHPSGSSGPATHSSDRERDPSAHPGKEVTEGL